MDYFNLIESNQAILGGKACIKSTRISVEMILNGLHRELLSLA